MAEPILELRAVSKRFGETVAADNLSLNIEAGEFFTFLGPSGSGKSTILRLIAGLEQPDSGEILLDGRDVAGVAPWHRNLGMMFQQYAIFPHMSVAENIGYGLKVRGRGRAAREARIARIVGLVGLAGMERRNATLLSGGEQQRVALARALAPEPRLLLLDEPLSALDESIRRTMQLELKHIQRQTGTTFLYVTHDQEEALTMSDRIAVFNRGLCLQCDEPERLYRRPRNRFVAGFFRGCNVLRAEILANHGGWLRVRLGGGEMMLDGRNGAATEGPIHIAIRAENLHLAPPYAAGSVTFAARIREIVYRGTVLDYVLELSDGQRVSATTTRPVGADAGATVTIHVDSAEVLPLED
jgi:ABC-type Fe3+/spermidine/putrescine transport system ATPase subunit